MVFILLMVFPPPVLELDFLLTPQSLKKCLTAFYNVGIGHLEIACIPWVCNVSWMRRKSTNDRSYDPDRGLNTIHIADIHSSTYIR